MPVIIVWISRHPPTLTQRDELTRLFGAHELRTDPAPFQDAADIKRRVHQLDAAEFVCVAPFTVLRKLLEYGLRPITAKMVQCAEGDAEVHTNGRHYRFVCFQRLTAIDLKYEEILPCCAGTTKMN